MKLNTGDWLREIGLAQYAEVFRANDIEIELLGRLTNDDLKDIGVASFGHRRKLLEAIAGLTGVSSGSPEPAIEPKAHDAAERRQVTVMFSDMVGSTALSTRMDPEDLREVIAAYQKCVSETVHRFGGFVAKYMGDGVLIYFGYPQAHEDDAERAVRAGLELIGAVAALRLSVLLQTRIGIATGLVVVGDLVGFGEAQERAVVGETPNLAARLQGIAEPNTVVIAESTRRLLGNFFELQDLGPKDLKGIAGAMRAWAALRASSVEGRFEALHASKLTALVGREEELELLRRRWGKAKTGEGQVVLLSGEAGIGKSRLTAALLENLAIEPHTRLRYFCSPQHTDSAFYPIIGQLERAAGLTREDTVQMKRDKLDELLVRTSTSAREAALFAEMLSLPNDARYPALELTPQQRRQSILEALNLQIEALTRSNPVLMIFDDVHWIDPTSLEALNRTVDRIRTLPALLIITFRPEFDAPWVGRSHMTSVALNRLGEREVAAIIAHLAGKNDLPAKLMADIVERTDGIPLFVEEMTKAVMEASNESAAERWASAIPPSALAVPASLHASLLARLDRLGPAKEVSQIGAAIGREFSYALLAAVWHKPEAELNSALDRLIAAGLLFRQGIPPHATYLFKHALVQDAAYGTLLRGRRQELHACIGRALEEEFPDTAETQPEILAHHFTQAGLDDRAIDYWRRAGARALRGSAYVEAVKHLNKGLDLANSLPASTDKVRKQLSLYLALGPTLQAMKGYAAAETIEAFSHARDLLDHTSSLSEHLAVRRGLVFSCFSRVELLEAKGLAQECLDLAAQSESTLASALAHRMLGQTLCLMGALVEARAHLERSLDLYASDEGIARAGVAHDYGGRSFALSYLSRALLPLGYPEQAVAAGTQAVLIAKSEGHAHTIAQALVGNVLLEVLGANVSNRDSADRAFVYCVEHGLHENQRRACFLQGAMLAKHGDLRRGIDVMRNALISIEQAGDQLLRPLFLGYLANAHVRLGDPRIGLELTLEAVACSEKSQGKLFEAELYRMRGEIFRELKQEKDAEHAMDRALYIARQQQARLWELRAASSLAGLWHEQGRSTDARDLLAPIYDWFTEGFDLPALKAAKRLLD
jgi:class 3 adenylate cyclase/predicted ATPase